MNMIFSKIMPVANNIFNFRDTEVVIYIYNISSIKGSRWPRSLSTFIFKICVN